MKKLLILGAGTAGTIVANKLSHVLSRDEWNITIVDQNETHYYQPGFLFIPFGIYGGRCNGVIRLQPGAYETNSILDLHVFSRIGVILQFLVSDKSGLIAPAFFSRLARIVKFLRPDQVPARFLTAGRMA